MSHFLRNVVRGLLELEPERRRKGPGRVRSRSVPPVQGLEDFPDPVAQRREVVPAFEHEGEPAARGPIGHGHERGCQEPEPVGCHLHPAERVPGRDVEAGARDDELRRELDSDRRQDRLEDVEEVGVGLAREKRDVQVVAVALTMSEETRRPAAGIERRLMGRKVEDVAALVEGLLRPVAVVKVPVDDEDPAQAVPADEVLGADRGVVEEAEAHGPRGLGVMAGGPDEREGVRNGPVHDAVERSEKAARGEERGFPSLRAGHRIAVHRNGLAGRGADEVDVAALVDEGELLVGRGAGLDGAIGDRRVLLEHPERGSRCGPAIRHVRRPCRGPCSVCR